LYVVLLIWYVAEALTGVLQVVPMASAKFGSFYPKQINANHMNMVKFVDANDPGYCIFIESLDAWMHDISSEFSDLQEGLEKEQQRQRASLLLPSAQGA
jgi:hypothetical protein